MSNSVSVCYANQAEPKHEKNDKHKKSSFEPHGMAPKVAQLHYAILMDEDAPPSPRIPSLNTHADTRATGQYFESTSHVDTQSPPATRGCTAAPRNMNLLEQRTLTAQHIGAFHGAVVGEPPRYTECMYSLHPSHTHISAVNFCAQEPHVCVVLAMFGVLKSHEAPRERK
jgi:hypothetical protein